MINSLCAVLHECRRSAFRLLKYSCRHASRVLARLRPAKSLNDLRCIRLAPGWCVHSMHALPPESNAGRRGSWPVGCHPERSRRSCRCWLPLPSNSRCAVIAQQQCGNNCAMASVDAEQGEEVDYEAQRAANIARNEEFMRSVGIHDVVEETKRQRDALKKKRSPRVKPAAMEPMRASKRNEGKTVSYTYDHSDRALGLQRESRPRGPGSVDWDNISCEDPEKSRAAAERAEAFAATSSLPSCVKVLLKSHVSGGFWLQLPSAFCASMPQDMGLNPQVMFDLYGRSGDGLPDEVPDDDVWEAIWLRKGSNGGGLSGGWRGFSIDNNLAAGDTIVFEKLEGHFLRGTIFRAIPLAENKEYCSRPAEQVAKVAEEVAALKASGKKRRYATITIRENAFRRAHVDGVPYKKGSSKKKQKNNAEVVAEEEAVEAEEFVVEKLIDTRRGAGGAREYHVKWYGYDDLADHTWETEKNLNEPPEKYDGFAEHVEPKLSKKEKGQVLERQEGTKKKVAQKKTQSASKASKASKAGKAGRARTAGGNLAAKKAKLDKESPEERLPKVGDQVDVDFVSMQALLRIVPPSLRFVALAVRF